MRIGLSTYTYTWAIGVPGSLPERPMDALDLLATAAELGVGVVQFADNLPLDGLSEADLAIVVDKAKSHGIDIEVGTRGIDPEHLARYVEIAQTVGSPFVRVVVDREGDHPSPAEARDRLLRSESAFRAAGLQLAIENHDRYSTAELVSLVSELGDWTAICLDTVNSFGSLEGPAVVIDALAPHTINLHVKDFDVVRIPGAMGFSVQGRAVGEGRLDVVPLVERLDRLGKTKSGIIELWTPREPTLEDTIATEAEWARRSVSYLRDVVGLN